MKAHSDLSAIAGEIACFQDRAGTESERRRNPCPQ